MREYLKIREGHNVDGESLYYQKEGETFIRLNKDCVCTWRNKTILHYAGAGLELSPKEKNSIHGVILGDYINLSTHTLYTAEVGKYIKDGEWYYIIMYEETPVRLDNFSLKYYK